MDIIAFCFFICILLGGGATTLWTGRIRATKTSLVEGLPARVIGSLLFLAIPLSIAAFFFSDLILGLFGVKPDSQSALPILFGCAPLLGCPLLGVLIGFATAKKTTVLKLVELSSSHLRSPPSGELGN